MFDRPAVALAVRGIAVATILAGLSSTLTTQPRPARAVVESRHGNFAADVGSRYAVRVVDSIDRVRAHLVEGSPGALQQLAQDPRVASVRDDPESSISETAIVSGASSDLLSSKVIELLRAPEVIRIGSGTVRKSMVEQPSFSRIEWDKEGELSTGRSIKVAVIDTGVDFEHPALRGAFIPGVDLLDPSGSGREPFPTGTAGPQTFTMAQLNPSMVAILNPTMVAVLNQPENRFLGHGTLVAGLIHVMAPDAWILPIRIFSSSGSSSSYFVAKAVRYAADQNVDVINMSFELNRPSVLVDEALHYAASRGVILVASAGNRGSTIDSYPASHPNVMAVAATDSKFHKASFSNYGAQAAVAAPGDALISTFPGGNYAAVAGTSFAAALVSGQASLVRSRCRCSAQETADRILRSARSIALQNPGLQVGAGSIRVNAALNVK